MVAIYPAAVKKFPYRHDFTDIVDAADVNVLYDEVSAVESTLGVNPQTDVIDGKINSWPTVSARISAVREGVSKPFVGVNANNVQVPYNEQTVMNWTSKYWDTHDMWTGGPTITCPRTGVYTFSIFMHWHSSQTPDDYQQPVFNRSGELFIALNPLVGHGNICNQSGYFPQGWQRSTHQTASFTAPWFEGVGIQMIAYQSCLTTPLTVGALLSIQYHRDAPTPNNL